MLFYVDTDSKQDIFVQQESGLVCFFGASKQQQIKKMAHKKLVFLGVSPLLQIGATFTPSISGKHQRGFFPLYWLQERKRVHLSQ